MKLTERLLKADDFQKKDSSQVSMEQDGAILQNPKGNRMAREAVVVTSWEGGVPSSVQEEDSESEGHLEHCNSTVNPNLTLTHEMSSLELTHNFLLAFDTHKFLLILYMPDLNHFLSRWSIP